MDGLVVSYAIVGVRLKAECGGWMPSQELDSESFRELISTCFRPHVGESAIDPAARQIEPLFRTPAKPSKRGPALIVGRFIVRDDDLRLFDTMTKMLGAAAGASFFLSGSPTAAAITGVAVGVITLLRDPFRNGAALRENEARLVWLLKASDNRLTDAEILQKLGAIKFHLDTDVMGSTWTTDRVAAALAKLQGIDTRNGLKCFVKKDAEGRWGLEGA